VKDTGPPSRPVPRLDLQSYFKYTHSYFENEAVFDTRLTCCEIRAVISMKGYV
jgi:hypothetical protein